MTKKLLVIAIASIVITSCQKTKQTKLTTKEDLVEEKNALTDETILSRVEVKNGAFNFKSKSDLIDLAAYLGNMKHKQQDLKNYYASKNKLMRTEIVIYFSQKKEKK